MFPVIGFKIYKEIKRIKRIRSNFIHLKFEPSFIKTLKQNSQDLFFLTFSLYKIILFFLLHFALNIALDFE